MGGVERRREIWERYKHGKRDWQEVQKRVQRTEEAGKAAVLTTEACSVT